MGHFVALVGLVLLGCGVLFCGPSMLGFASCWSFACGVYLLLVFLS